MDSQFQHNNFVRICWAMTVFIEKKRHFWSRENPKPYRRISNQGRQIIHVWCGIYKWHILGNMFLNQHLNGLGYINLLQNQIILLLNNEEDSNYIPDVYHNTKLVRNFFSEQFIEWIELNGNVPWPPIKPGLTPLDFFLWGATTWKI